MQVVLQHNVLTGIVNQAIATVLSHAGCKLILAARRVEELERVRDKLVNKSATTAKILQFDLANLNEVPQKVEEALSFYGQIDILINNGGISVRSTIAETSLEVDQKVMLVNYFGQVALTKGMLDIR